MTPLTIATVLSLAMHCAGAVDPQMIAGIAQRESGLDPLTLHDNISGQIMHGPGTIGLARQLIAAGHSVDLGLMQINSHNLAMLGLGIPDAFDACRNIAAAARLIQLFSQYNTGSPVRGIANGYAAGVMRAVHDVKAGEPPKPVAPPATVDTSEITPEPQPPPQCDAPKWDTWAYQDCQKTGSATPETDQTGEVKR